MGQVMIIRNGIAAGKKLCPFTVCLRPPNIGFSLKGASFLYRKRVSHCMEDTSVSQLPLKTLLCPALF